MFNKKICKEILGGCLTDYKKYLSGYYKGFYIMLELIGNRYLITINASSANDPDNQNLKAYLEKHKESIKQLTDITVYPHHVKLYYTAPALIKKMPVTVNTIVEPIINYLIAGRYTSGCQTCGTTTEQISCYEVNGTHHYICNSCSQTIEESLRNQQQDILLKKSNLLGGLVGALLGSLIGCVLWVVIYNLGYIAGIAGAVTGICAMKGYEMLGGSLDKKGVIGSVVIMIIMIFFANKTAWAWDAYSVYKDYGITFFECFRGIGELITESDLTAVYYGNLAAGYLLTALASFGTIKSALKESTGSYSVKKVN